MNVHLGFLIVYVTEQLLNHVQISFQKYSAWICEVNIRSTMTAFDIANSRETLSNYVYFKIIK